MGTFKSNMYSAMRGLAVFAVLCLALAPYSASAEPISREVRAEIIAGYDFIVVQQQGDGLKIRHSDPLDFRDRADNPAKFSFGLKTSREKIDQCSIKFITWQKQIDDAKRKALSSGGTLDVSYTPGLAGYLKADKSVLTGTGDFSAAVSKIEADFFGKSRGEPTSAAHAAEIVQSASAASPLKFANPLDTFEFNKKPNYSFQSYFKDVPNKQSMKWLRVGGTWGDARYVIYSLPCSALISLPDLAPAIAKPPVIDTKPDKPADKPRNGTPKPKPKPDPKPDPDPDPDPIMPLLVMAGLAGLVLGGVMLARAGRRNSAKKRKGDISKSKSAGESEDDVLIAKISTIAAGTGLAAGLGAKASSPPRPTLKERLEENPGVLFAGSPLLAANVAVPLSAAGQLTASSLQMLTGAFTVLRPAYQATGRIGYSQEGIPTAEDYAFGTGFLISPNHVMTNRHVHGFYGHYLTGEDCAGIEFIAEKGKDASDFYAFDGQPPVLLPGLDIAIFRLENPAAGRKPLEFEATPIEDLDKRDIVVVGYPDCLDPESIEVAEVVEADAVFAVKRISQGKIFRHSTDSDVPYGVETRVSEDDQTNFFMPAICHNASTMTGNSGSPILDAKTGALLGVHFAGYKVFNAEEAANLAMTIAQIKAENTLPS